MKKVFSFLWKTFSNIIQSYRDNFNKSLDRHVLIKKHYTKVKYIFNVQKALLKSNWQKVLIMMLSIMFATFFSFVGSLILSISSEFSDAYKSELAPYNSQGSFSHFPKTWAARDPYLGFDEPQVLNSGFSINKDSDSLLPRLVPQVPSTTYALGVFNYKHIMQSSSNLNCTSLFKDSGIFSDVTNLKRNVSAEDMIRTNTSVSLFASMLEIIGVGGLGGSLFNPATIDAITFVDSYNCFNYDVHKGEPEDDLFLAPVKASHEIAKIIVQALLKGGPGYIQSFVARFEKYVKPDPNVPLYDVSFSSFLNDILSEFAPSFISREFIIQQNQIFNEYISAEQKFKSSDIKEINLKYNMQYFLDITKNSKAFLSFGLAPYDKNTDELATELKTNIKKGNKSLGQIYTEGINESSRFFNKNVNGKNALVNADAYQPYLNKLLLPTGTKDNAIPVLINKTTEKTLNVHIGDYLTADMSRVDSRYMGYSPSRKKYDNNIFGWNEVKYYHVVGEMSTGGSPIIFTSRQEANLMIFTQPIPNVVKNPENGSKPETDWSKGYKIRSGLNECIWYQPISPEMDPEYVHATSKNSSSYADNRGFFNTTFFLNKNNPNKHGVILVGNGSLSLLSSRFDIYFGLTKVIDGFTLASNLNNAEFMLMSIMFPIVIVLFLLSIIVLVLSQRTILSSLRKNIAALKVLGYSRGYVLFITTGFFFVFGGIVFAFVLLLNQPLNHFMINYFSTFLGSKLYIPIEFLKWYSLLIYIVIIACFYISLVIFSLRSISKAKPKDIISV